MEKYDKDEEKKITKTDAMKHLMKEVKDLLQLRFTDCDYLLMSSLKFDTKWQYGRRNDMMLFRENEVMSLAAYLKGSAAGDGGDIDKAKIDKILHNMKETRKIEFQVREQKKKTEREKKIVEKEREKRVAQQKMAIIKSASSPISYSDKTSIPSELWVIILEYGVESVSPKTFLKFMCKLRLLNKEWAHLIPKCITKLFVSRYMEGKKLHFPFNFDDWRKSIKENSRSDIADFLEQKTVPDLKSICSDLDYTYRGANIKLQNIVGIIENCFGSIEAARAFDLELLYLFSKVNDCKCISTNKDKDETLKLLESTYGRERSYLKCITTNKGAHQTLKLLESTNGRERPSLKCIYCSRTGNKNGLWTLNRLMDHERNCARRIFGRIV